MMTTQLLARGRKFALAIASVTVFFTAALSHADYCARATYDRGIGKPPTACADDDRAMDEGLCYKKCDAGWDGKATNCVQNCPAGFRDDGLFCAKPAQPAPYGVGTGYPWKVGDPVGNFDRAGDRCRADNPQGCVRDGLIWYPNCKSGFHKTGALICSPNEVKCPGGWADIGVSCTKPTKARGVGVLPNGCGSGQAFEAGLCYSACKPNYAGFATMCNQKCPASAPYVCAVAGCAANQSECKQAMLAPATTVFGLVADELYRVGADEYAAGKIIVDSIKSAVNRFSQELSGVYWVDLISLAAVSTGVSLTTQEMSAMVAAFRGQEFLTKDFNREKLRAISKAYSKPQTCAGA
jgi:hypothetical protein